MERGSNTGSPTNRGRAGLVAVVTLGALAVAAPASAHPGHGEHGETAFATGLLHPFTGVDHLLALLAVGALAVLVTARRANWLLPLGFVAGMAAGGALGLAGGGLRAVDVAIAGSVLVLGLMVVLVARPGSATSLPVVALVVGVAGAAHGYGHGVGLPATGAAFDYGVGILVATTAALAMGIALGIGVRRVPVLRLATGSVVSVAGLALLAGA